MNVLVYCIRSARVASITLFFLVAFPILRTVDAKRAPRLLRWYFASCGGAFVKLGQFLATRYDLLPADYCAELEFLLDRLDPIDVRSIQRVIEKDLKASVSELFASFEPEPLGSASIAQVHRGALADGTSVAVKVKRPDIAAKFRIDTFNMRLIASVLDSLGILGKVGLTAVVREFARLCQEELDFQREAQNMQILHNLMRADDLPHYAPRVFFDRSGQSVITMEYLSGVWVSDFLRAIEGNDHDQLREWKRQGITPERTALLLFYSNLVQCFTHRLFHADPHPANLVLMRGGTLGYVDFGMVGWLDERTWTQQIKLRQYLAQDMLFAAYETLLDSLEPIPRHIPDWFEYEVKDFMRQYVLASRSSALNSAEKSSGYFFLRLSDSLRRAGLKLPATAMRVSRAMVIADSIMLRLDPEVDWLPELRRYLREEAWDQVGNMLTAGRLFDLGSALLLNVMNVSQFAGDTLDWAQRTLPSFGRTYLREFSLIEEVVLATLDFFRAAFLLVVIAMSGLWTATYFGLDLPWHQSVSSSTQLLFIAGGLVSVLVLRRLRHRLAD